MLNNIMGWRTVMQYAAYSGFVLAIIFYWVIRDHPNTTPSPGKAGRKLSIYADLHAILTHPQSLWIGVTAFASWSAMGSLAELWGVDFLSTFHDLDTQGAAHLVMIIWIGVAVGSPLAGWWTERTPHHLFPLSCLLGLSFVTSLCLLYVPTPPYLTYANLFLLGAASGAQPITFSLIASFTPPERIGTAFGFNNMAVVCGALLQPVIGALLDWFAINPREYTLGTYQLALSVVPLAVACGLFACYRLYRLESKKTLITPVTP
jgi:predicted MFS family arabinose efflux permease